MKVLTLIRGAQGSGKSTLGKAMVAAGLAKHHLETDQYFVDASGKYRWFAKGIPAAHKWCQEATKQIMHQGDSLVVTNTFTSREHTVPYYALAAEYGYKVQEIVIMRPVFDNEHRCSPETVDRFQRKLEDDIRGRHELEDIHC